MVPEFSDVKELPVALPGVKIVAPINYRGGCIPDEYPVVVEKNGGGFFTPSYIPLCIS